MDTRQELILKSIIEEYIQTAEPVGSKFLALKLDLGVSPATIRNDMMTLEEEGYLRSPHTSAGRIPTEKGYEYYLRHFAEARCARGAETRLRRAVGEMATQEAVLKTLAKTLADLSGETAIVAMNPRFSYYVGVSNLFQKPEFQNFEIIHALTDVLDRFDEVVADLFDATPRTPRVLMGRASPFGRGVAAVVVKDAVGLIGLIGPMRMDYNRNLGLLEETLEILHDECSYGR